MSTEYETIQATTLWTPEGRYLSALTGDDEPLLLFHNPADAYRYAAVVMLVAAYAEQDQAVMAQLHAVGDAERAAAAVVALRAKRPPLDDAATEPFRFEPMLSGRTGIGKVNGYLHGEQFTQWSQREARQHALQVVDAAYGGILDTGYWQLLTEKYGMSESDARAVVHSLRDYRPRPDTSGLTPEHVDVPKADMSRLGRFIADTTPRGPGHRR